jgi:hypothetical protein
MPSTEVIEMPQSRTRKRNRPASRRRDRTRQVRARETQAAQQQAERKRISPQTYRRRRILGWTLVALGVGVGLQHLGHHLGFYTLISEGWDDLVAGYPLAGLLGVVGAIVLSR